MPMGQLYIIKAKQPEWPNDWDDQNDKNNRSLLHTLRQPTSPIGALTGSSNCMWSLPAACPGPDWPSHPGWQWDQPSSYVPFHLPVQPQAAP